MQIIPNAKTSGYTFDGKGMNPKTNLVKINAVKTPSPERNPK